MKTFMMFVLPTILFGSPAFSASPEELREIVAAGMTRSTSKSNGYSWSPDQTCPNMFAIWKAEREVEPTSTSLPPITYYIDCEGDGKVDRLYFSDGVKVPKIRFGSSAEAQKVFDDIIQQILVRIRKREVI